MHSIATALGKPLGLSCQTLDHRVNGYAQLCVEINPNISLLESVEIRLGDMSYIQQADYEALPFWSRLCHEYGHLQSKFPNSGGKTPYPQPKKYASNSKGKGKGLVQNEGTESKEFILVKGKKKATSVAHQNKAI